MTVTRLKQEMQAPDFELVDTGGNTIRLSDYREKQNVVLVLLRGFM